MKHKYYEMIVAKAADMGLVVFCKHETEGWMAISDGDYLPQNPDNDHFLCLPQHKEAVLNSLNGGVAQFESPREKGDHALEKADWSNSEWYMQSDATSRIKPKKEKRWIVVTEDLEIEDGTLYKSYGEAEINNHGTQQVVEIEVEV